MSPEQYSIGISGVDGTVATVSAYDPINNVSVPVTIASRSANSLTLGITAADYPYLLTIDDATSGGTSGGSGEGTIETGGSGGGGGGGGYIAPITTSNASSTVSSTSPSSLEAELVSLEAELESLLLQAQNAGIPLPMGATAYLPPSGGSTSFTRNLTIGSKGSDVEVLQHYLNTHGFPVNSIPTYAGSLGYETQYFGKATQTALAEFQKSVGISPAVGFFGPITRAYVLTHTIKE